MAMRQELTQSTYFTEIMADDNNEPVEKFPLTQDGKHKISAPPPRGKNV